MRVIPRENLVPWLHALQQSRVLVGPVERERTSLFAPVAEAGELRLDLVRTTLPAKEWFFPRSEGLFSVVQANGTVELVRPAAATPAVLFGLRPCDARALQVLDKVFLDAPPDAQYASRRANTALVGLACTQAAATCFCTSVGLDPHAAEGLDVLLAEAGDGYAVLAATAGGEELLALATIAEGAPDRPPRPELPALALAGLGENLVASFPTAYWERASAACLSCKICTYTCPTCHCFDVRDCWTGCQTERTRCWDSCQSALFNRIAGGFNPRPTKGARRRQFVYHKYLYFPERFGLLQCVGCGRCVANCPVNIDLREILQDVSAGKALERKEALV